MYISFYTAKVNQLALRFRQGGSEPAIQVPGVSAPQLQGLTRICLAKVVSWMERLEEEEQERCNLKEEVDDSQFIAV